MMMMAPLEVEIETHEARVRIAWEDDHESLYPFRYLRGFCPCAACQGHSGGWEFVPVDSPVITAVTEVGNYALGIDWDDGGKKHTTGIYSFDNLRQLCPCDACLRAAGPHHPMRRMPG
jgi:DUF971 family protein